MDLKQSLRNNEHLNTETGLHMLLQDKTVRNSNNSFALFYCKACVRITTELTEITNVTFSSIQGTRRYDCKKLKSGSGESSVTD